MNYRERLKIDPDNGDSTKFFTKNGLLVAAGYTRVVIGDRGPYIEFSDDQIVKQNIFIPAHQQYRLTADYVYYHEYRTNEDDVKLYYQRKTVNYADYKIGFWYISPFALKTEEHEEIVIPLPKKQKELREDFE